MSELVLGRDRLQSLLKDFMNQNGADYHLQKIGFFGSYACAQATAESDVDIVFVTDKPNLLTTSAIKQDLEALLGRKVDVIRLHQYLSPGFRERIKKEAVYV
ncbi:MAG: nucleotidyltransferase domain-containing protein [Phormidesmis sp.]